VPFAAGFTVCFVNLKGCRAVSAVAVLDGIVRTMLPVREFGLYRGERSFSGL